jgi:hypothetical protein
MRLAGSENEVRCGGGQPRVEDTAVATQLHKGSGIHPRRRVGDCNDSRSCLRARCTPAEGAKVVEQRPQLVLLLLLLLLLVRGHRVRDETEDG